MARRRRKKKSLSGLGALSIDPKILIGGLVLVGVGVTAFFLLRKKDDAAAEPVATGQDAMMSMDAGMSSGTGTPVDSGVPATPPASAPSAIPGNPALVAKLRTRQIGPARTSQLVKNLLTR
jgi:hypothetical protein